MTPGCVRRHFCIPGGPDQPDVPGQILLERLRIGGHVGRPWQMLELGEILLTARDDRCGGCGKSNSGGIRWETIDRPSSLGTQVVRGASIHQEPGPLCSPVTALVLGWHLCSMWMLGAWP